MKENILGSLGLLFVLSGCTTADVGKVVKGDETEVCVKVTKKLGTCRTIPPDKRASGDNGTDNHADNL